MNGSVEQPFGRLRSLLWPVHNHEHKRLLPMFVLFFLINFIYNLLRNMKMSLMITAKSSGAHVIPFLKIGAVLPAALLMTWLFTKLVSKYSRERVFYTMLFGFLLYFFLFTFLLFPYQDHLRLDKVADFLQRHLLFSEGFQGFIASIRYWNLSLFYTLSEMWSVVILTMLFWGFANEITKIEEAKRFYAIFAIGANTSNISIGAFANWLNKQDFWYISYYKPEFQWVFYQLVTALIVGLGIFSLFYWLNKNILDLESAEELQIPKKKNNLSMRECFSYVSNSTYLIYIVVIVVAYNIVHNLSDVLWCYKVSQVYTNSSEYNQYIGNVTAATGIVAVLTALLVSGNVIRFYGWTVAALITPLVWLLAGIGFAFGIWHQEFYAEDILYSFLGNPVNLVILMGTIQICLGRGCKYTIFDQTKEMAFIPLGHENKRKGKAIVDGLASRFGKSGGSIIYIVLLMVFGNLATATPYVLSIMLVSIVMWLVAVIRLGSLVDEASVGSSQLQPVAVASSAVLATSKS